MFSSAPQMSSTSGSNSPGSSVFRRNSNSPVTSAFGQSSNPLGFAPNNGEISGHVQGHTNLFGSAPTSGETPVPAFGQSSNQFGFSPTNGGTSVPAFGRSGNSFEFTPKHGGTLVSVPTNGSPANFQTPAINAFSSPGFWCVSSGPLFSGVNRGGSRVTSYTETVEVNAREQISTKILSISAMPVYKDKCHEELRWEDNQFGDNGTQGNIPIFDSIRSGQSAIGSQSKGSRIEPYTKTMVGEGISRATSISAMPVYQNKSHEELRCEDHEFNDAGGVDPASVQLNASGNPVARTGSSFLNPMPSVQFNPFAPSPPCFSFPTCSTSFSGNSCFSTSCEPFSTTVMTHSCGLKSSSSLAPTTPFSIPFTTNSSSNNSCGNFSTSVAHAGFIFEPNKSSSFFSPPISGFHTFSPPTNIFNIAQFCPAPLDTPFTSNSFLNDPREGLYTSITQPPFIYGPTSPFSLPYPSITSTSAGAATTLGPSSFNYTSFAPSASICSTSVTAPVTASVPCNFPPTTSTVNAVSPSTFSCSAETPHAVPQIPAEGLRTTSVRYGISCIPVSDRPSPVRSSSLLTIKHLSNHRQKQLSTPKYNHKGDGPKVSFFADAHKTPTTARKEVLLLPRDNPRALLSGPSEEWNLRVNFENISDIKHTSINVYENGEVCVELSTPLMDGSMYQAKKGNSGETFAAEHILKPNSVNGDHPFEKVVSSHVSNLMPKLKHSDYFIKPQIEELAVKESFEPGFCSHVKDFVVGHRRYGSIKFLGETDVRQLDVNSHFVFRDREVVVYMDESKKLPVGQGFNKAAEITLYNINCVDKTGNHHIIGPNVDKYKEKLMKKAAEQGAEFVSYDPVQGEWKLRVGHF